MQGFLTCLRAVTEFQGIILTYAVIFSTCEMCKNTAHDTLAMTSCLRLLLPKRQFSLCCTTTNSEQSCFPELGCGAFLYTAP